MNWLSKFSLPGLRRSNGLDPAKWLSGHLDHAVHLSVRHRFMYVANPKVGCSSIIWTLRSLESDEPGVMPETVGRIHDRSGSPLPRFSEVGGPELLRDPDWFRFTFVRNPFDRLMSCYLQKIVRPTAEREAFLALIARPAGDDREITFSEFINGIAEQSPIDMDPHWRVQSLQTLQDIATYDFVGRFEQFDQDLAEVGSCIPPRFAEYLHRERRQATGPKPVAKISPDTADTIRRVFAEDFERFSYPLDVPAGSIEP